MARKKTNETKPKEETVNNENLKKEEVETTEKLSLEGLNKRIDKLEEDFKEQNNNILQYMTFSSMCKDGTLSPLVIAKIMDDTAKMKNKGDTTTKGNNKSDLGSNRLFPFGDNDPMFKSLFFSMMMNSNNASKTTNKSNSVDDIAKERVIFAIITSAINAINNPNSDLFDSSVKLLSHTNAHTYEVEVFDETFHVLCVDDVKFVTNILERWGFENIGIEEHKTTSIQNEKENAKKSIVLKLTHHKLLIL